MFGAKPFPDPMLTYFSQDLLNIHVLYESICYKPLIAYRWHVMACRLLDAMPFHEPMQTYCSMDLLNKLYERIWYEPFIAYVWHCQGCIEVYCLFKMSPDQWRAITWTTADLLFIETFWTNSGFTFLKPSLLWFATFKKTSLSRNHTAGPLCRDPTGLVGSLHRDQQCVFLGVSLNKLYDVMEVISVLLAPCAGNPQTPVDSPHKWSAVGIFFWCTSC